MSPLKSHLSLTSAGLGSRLASLADALEDLLTVLVQLQLGDDDLGGVDADGHALAVGLLADDTLDVDDVFETVDGGDLALATLVGAPDDGDLVVLADGNSADLPGVRRKILFFLQSVSRAVSCLPATQWSSFRVGCSAAGKNLVQAYVVLLTQFLAQRSAHNHSTLAGRSAEVRLARLPARARDSYPPELVSIYPIAVSMPLRIPRSS